METLTSLSRHLTLLLFCSTTASAAVITLSGDLSLHTNSANAGGAVTQGTVASQSVRLYSATGQIGGAISSNGTDSLFLAFIPTLYFDTSASLVTLLSPANRAELSSSSVLFQWDALVSHALITYRLQVALDDSYSAIVLDTAGITSTSATCLIPANARYVWRVIASFGDATVYSSGSNFTIDTQAPGAPALLSPSNSGSVISLLVDYRWTAASDSSPSNATLYSATGPGISAYRLHVSTNGSFTDTFHYQETTDTALTPYKTYTNGATYYWRLAAVDRAGNLSAWTNGFSFTKTQSVDTTPPSSVNGFTALALDTGAILLTWSASPSVVMESGYYRLSWDSGTGFGNLSVIETRAHPSANAAFTYLTPILTGGVQYSFEVRAVSGANVSDSGTIQRATARTQAIAVPNLEFITPQTDKRRVDRGGGIQIEVRPLSGDPYLSSLSSVRFQYRRGAAGSWVDATASSNGNWSNPTLYDGQGNIGMHWDAAALTNDSYELRAVPKSTNGHEYSQKAPCIVIELVTGSANSDVSSTYTENNMMMELEEKLHGTISETISTSLPNKHEVSVQLDANDIPMNSSGQAPKLYLALAESLPQDAGLPDSIQASGPVVDIRFSTYEQPKNEVVVTISLGETRVKNGVLQSKTLRGWTPVSSLRCYRYDGAWVEITEFTVDTAAGVIRIRTSHFSLFRAAAPETNIVTGLTSVGLETPVGTFRTRSASVLFRWTPALGDDTPSIRYRLQTSTTSGFGTIAQETANVVETSATLTLPVNVSYYWRVISSDTSGDSLVSTQMRLVIIDTAPPMPGAMAFPTDTYPKIAVRNATRLGWYAATDSDYVDSYRVQLWRTDTTPGSLIVDAAMSSSQLETTIAALTPGTYYWRVWTADGLHNETSTGYKMFQVFKTGDVTEDDSVTSEDYFSFGRTYGTTTNALPDLDLDGDVDINDIRILLQGS